MKCKIDITPQGDIKVTGENASLFYDALLFTGKEATSLDIYSISLTDEFKNTGLKPTVENVMNFIKAEGENSIPFFTKEELVDLIGIDTESLLNAITENNEFSLTKENMLSFYTSREADEILMSPELQNKLQELRNKLITYTESLEEINVPNLPIVELEEEISSIGKYKTKDLAEVHNDIGRVLSGATTVEEAEEALLELGEEYAKHAEELFETFKDTTALQQYTEDPITGEIVKKVFNSTIDRILTTMEVGKDMSDTIGTIDAILETQDYILQDNSIVTEDVLKQLAEELTVVGLDFSGIVDTNRSISEIKGFLYNISNFLQDPIRNIDYFAKMYNSFFNINEDNNRVVIEEIKDNNLMVIETTKSEVELFEKYSVVKVRDNIYKKVKRDDRPIEEKVYNMVREGILLFNEDTFYPIGFNKDGNFDIKELQQEKNKKAVLDVIKRVLEDEAATIQTSENYSIEVLKELTAYKMKFSTQSFPKSKEVYYNTFYKENTDSFVDKFIIELNRFLLKNPSTPIVFTQNGIELPFRSDYTAAVVLRTLPEKLRGDLVNYAKITNKLPNVLNVSEKEFNSDIEGDTDFNRNFYTNFKEELPPFKGLYKYNNELLEASTNLPFIKIKGEVYEKVGENIYSKVEDQNTFSWTRKGPKKIETSKEVLTLETTKKVFEPKELTENIDQCRVR